MTTPPSPHYILALATLHRTRGDIDHTFGAVVAACGDIDTGAALTRAAWQAWHPAGLTAREREVLLLLAGGHDYNAVALRAKVEYCTVNAHVSNVLRKLNVPNAISAVVLALKLGLISIDAVEIVSISSCNQG